LEGQVKMRKKSHIWVKGKKKTRQKKKGVKKKKSSSGTLRCQVRDLNCKKEGGGEKRVGKNPSKAPFLGVKNKQNPEGPGK